MNDADRAENAALCDHLEVSAERATADGRVVDAALIRAAITLLSEGAPAAPAPAAPARAPAGKDGHRHTFDDDGMCTGCGDRRKRPGRPPKVPPQTKLPGVNGAAAEPPPPPPPAEGGAP